MSDPGYSISQQGEKKSGDLEEKTPGHLHEASAGENWSSPLLSTQNL